MVVVIENVMEMRAPTGKTLSFRYVGNPPAQRRAWFTFRRGFRLTGMVAANRGWFYDPDARSKEEFRDVLTAAMADLDITLLPFLGV